MRWKRIAAAALTFLLLFGGATVLAAGSASDPLISRSYWKTAFQTPLDTYWQTVKTVTDAAIQAKTAELKTEASAYLLSHRYGDIAAQVAAKLGVDSSAQTAGNAMQQYSLKKGDRICGAPGASMLFLSGAGKTCGSSELLNVTAGSTRKPGQAIKTGILYLILEGDGSGIEVTSETATVLAKDGAEIRHAAEPQYTALADALCSLGLFKGTGIGYELERAPTRQEALVMLIRLLGEEADALACTEKTPFTDPPTWKDGMKYIAYGYSQGYTNGTSPKTFSPEAPSAAEQYLTFVLRSLGYRDGADFIWNTTSRDLALRLGLVTERELSAMDQSGFLRDHVVLFSFRALSAPMKDGTGSLGDRLVREGILTASALQSALSQTF